MKWLRRQRSSVSEAILIATAGEDLEYKNFRLRPWKEVCLALRRAAVTVGRSRHTLAAMILAFVGAVEQNRLQLPGGLAGKLGSGGRIQRVAELTAYLDRWLSEKETYG